MRTPPRAMSLTDPGAALSTKHGPSVIAYGLDAMVDTGSGIVLEVQAAPERFADEPIAARRMVERLRERHRATPGVLTGDKAYGAGPFLAWLESRNIEAHVSLIDRRHQTGGMLTQVAFVYNEATDTYTCPQGAILKRYGTNDASQRCRASRAATAGPAPSRRAARTARCARLVALAPRGGPREGPGPPGHSSRPPLHAAAQGRRASVRPHQAPRRAAASPTAGPARRRRAVRARSDGAKPQAHGPVGRPLALAGRDAGVGNLPKRGVQARRRKGTAFTNLPSADGNDAPRRATPSLLQHSQPFASSPPNPYPEGSLTGLWAGYRFRAAVPVGTKSRRKARPHIHSPSSTARTGKARRDQPPARAASMAGGWSPAPHDRIGPEWRREQVVDRAVGSTPPPSVRERCPGPAARCFDLRMGRASPPTAQLSANTASRAMAIPGGSRCSAPSVAMAVVITPSSPRAWWMAERVSVRRIR